MSQELFDFTGKNTRLSSPSTERHANVEASKHVPTLPLILTITGTCLYVLREVSAYSNGNLLMRCLNHLPQLGKLDEKSTGMHVLIVREVRCLKATSVRNFPGAMMCCCKPERRQPVQLVYSSGKLLVLSCLMATINPVHTSRQRQTLALRPLSTHSYESRFTENPQL